MVSAFVSEGVTDNRLPAFLKTAYSGRRVIHSATVTPPTVVDAEWGPLLLGSFEAFMKRIKGSG